MAQPHMKQKKRSARKVDETSRNEILRLLKLNGELSVFQLCIARKVTHTAIRRQLSALEQEGLVTHSLEETGIGRPIHKFKLTAESARSFPTDYEGVASSLVDTVLASSGHRGVLDFLHSANDRAIHSLRSRLQILPLEQRVDELCKHFRNAGYMSEWHQLPDNNFFLFHQNCAIYNLAAKYRQFCLLELHLIQTVLGVKVTRQQYMFKGQSTCGYLIHAAEGNWT